MQEDAAGKLDLAFEDLGEALKNIVRPVRTYRIATGLVPGTALQMPALPLPRQTVNRGAAVTEYEVATRTRNTLPMAWSRRSLPRCRASAMLFVIARNSRFTYKGQAVDVKQ